MKGRAFVVLLLSAASATAQHNPGSTVPKVRVRVAFANGACDESAHVTLSAHNGPLVEGTENDRCEVEFANVPEGDYHVSLSGADVTTADSNSSINVSSSGPADFEVPVKRTSQLDGSGMALSAFVSASDLAIPGRARKEFDRANQLIRKHEFAQAVEKLNKAIAIYPSYAVAYNNLGVIYSRLGDRVHENESLQKAISLNPHFALAYTNLGRMDISSAEYPAAETVLQKAAEFNPADPLTLILLCYSEFMDREFDAAVATSRKAHSLDKPHAFVHRVAARAFEQERLGANAVAELELFLKEEPPGPRADAARKELEIVKSVLP